MIVAAGMSGGLVSLDCLRKLVLPAQGLAQTKLRQLHVWLRIFSVFASFQKSAIGGNGRRSLAAVFQDIGLFQCKQEIPGMLLHQGLHYFQRFREALLAPEKE